MTNYTFQVIIENLFERITLAATAIAIAGTMQMSAVSGSLPSQGLTTSATLPAGRDGSQSRGSDNLAATVNENVPKPTQAQLDWLDMERYAFIHFSTNTFTDQEWGNGSEDPAIFNPAKLDCRQWARVCRDAGLKGIIVTAKHHSGFCLWPSRYTEYSVKNCPWKDGKGDIIRELREACDEYGLKLGIYLSPWDRNRADYGEPSYIEYFRNQLTELLTDYGDIFEVWFDGANGGWGYYGGANENRNIDRSTYYGWPETVALVRKLQPSCVIWNEAGPDIRWCGNEQGVGSETNWSRYDYEGHVPGEPDYATLSIGEKTHHVLWHQR